MLVNQGSNILLSLQFIGSGVAQTSRDGTSVDMQAATPTNIVRRARKEHVCMCVCFKGGDNVDIV